MEKVDQRILRSYRKAWRWAREKEKWKWGKGEVLDEPASGDPVFQKGNWSFKLSFLTSCQRKKKEVDRGCILVP